MLLTMLPLARGAPSASGFSLLFCQPFDKSDLTSLLKAPCEMPGGGIRRPRAEHEYQLEITRK